MSAPTTVSVRLEPMNEAEFQESIRRSIQRHASDYVRRGLFSEEAALPTWERELAQMFPDGRVTPEHFFAIVVDGRTGERVGETWYLAQEKGGKIRFWVDWIGIDPKHRRKGYATATLFLLEQEARKRGADRIGLGVWFDNPGAFALYAKLGYVTTNMWMMKSLGAVPRDDREVPGHEGGG